MIEAALLVLAQDGFVDRQVRSQFCAQNTPRRRRRCEEEWRHARR